MKMGDGHWSPQDVRWLEETLRNMPDQNQPVVFVTHYPIDDGIANWFVVLDLLKKYNIQAVLCGHVHRNGKYNFEGVPGVSGRSNLRGAATAGGYNLVEVRDGQMTFSEQTPGGTSKPPWHSVALARHHFAGATNQYPRPGFSINSRYANVQRRWQFDTGYTIASTPAIGKDSAIVGDASGTVYALALQSGGVQWKFKAQNAVYSTPEISGDRVVFASTDGTIYALAVASGQTIWKYKTDRPMVACPRVAEGVIYVGSSESKFRALDLASGKLLWEFEGVTGFVETRPLIQEGKVIFGAWDGHLYGLEARTGALAWKWKGDKPGDLLSPAACWPVAADGKVFVVAPDRRMTAIDVRTGEQIWRTGDFMVRESIGMSEDGNRFYVRAMQDFIYAFSTASTKPDKVWECKAAFGYDINSGMLVEKDGTVFYGTKNGLLIALDARTGAIKWQHRVGVALLNTVAPLNANEALTTDLDGKVTLIESAK
jgi:outer membrane protein assembly factor BamB